MGSGYSFFSGLAVEDDGIVDKMESFVSADKDVLLSLVVSS